MRQFKRIIASSAFVFLSVCPPAIAADAQATDLVAKHLQSLGTSNVRSQLKSRVIEGGATYRILVGGSGAIDGRAVFASEGPKSNLLLKINTVEYRGEQFICDGNKTFTAGTYSDKSRSEFGGFLRGEDIVIREGLLGGAWSTGWALSDPAVRGAKLKYLGRKTMDGRELEAIAYQPKKSTDLEITLFFDAETFHHVMTTYKASMQAGIASSDIETPQRQPTRYRIEERFSEFQTADGFTLPSRYDLRFTEELASGFTKTVEWEVKANRILSNVTLDPRNFEIK